MAIRFIDEEENKAPSGVRFIDEEPEEVPQHDDSWMYNVASEKQINEWRNKGTIGMVEAFNRFDKWDIVPYLGSAKDGIENTAMYMKLQKAANGETLSTKDQQNVSAFLKDYTEIQARGYSLGGNFVNAALGSVPFMLEAAIAIGTFGAGAGATATTTGAKVGAKQALKAATKQALSSQTRKAVMATQGKMLATITKNYGDRLLNDGIAITDKGQAIAKQAEKNPAMTAVKALADTNIELATEAFVGRAFRPLATAAGVKAQKIMPKKLIEGLDALGKTKGGKLASELLKAKDKVGFNGFLEEHGEEIVGNVLKTTLDLDDEEGYSFEQFVNAAVPSIDEFLITSGVIAVQGGMSLGTYKTLKALERRGATKEDIDNVKTQMSENEKEKIASDLQAQEPKIVEETPPGVEQLEDVTDEQPQYDYGLTEEGTGFVPETEEKNTKDSMAQELAQVEETENQKMDGVLKGAVSVDVKKVDNARKTQLRSEIKTVDNQLTELSRQWDKAFKSENDKEVQRIEAEMDKLVEQRDSLELERELIGKDIITTKKGRTKELFVENGDTTDVVLSKDGKVLGKLKETDESGKLLRLEHSENDLVQMTVKQVYNIQKADRVLRAISQGFKSGVAMTKASLKIAQREYKNLVKLLPQSERGKVAFDFQKFNSVEQATKNIDEFEKKIEKILKKAELKAYQDAIGSLFAEAKPKKQGSKKVSARGFKTSEIGRAFGNATADMQAALGKILAIVKPAKNIINTTKAENRQIKKLQKEYDALKDIELEVDEKAASEMLVNSMNPENPNAVDAEIADAVIGYQNGNLEKTKKLYGILDSLITGRKIYSMLKMEAEKQALEEDLKTGIDSIQGNAPVSTQQPPITTKEKVKVFMRQLAHSFYSVVGKLDIISMHDQNVTTNSVTGRKISRLSTMFDTLAPTSKELAGIYAVREKFTEFITKFESLKHLTDERKYLKFMTEKGRKNVDLTYTSSTGETVTLKLSKTELYDFYMKFKAATIDPVIKASLREGNKFSFIEDKKGASTEQAILNALSEKEDTDFADAMLEFYDWYYDRVNTEYFRPKFGIDMTKNKFFSPSPKENVDFGSATANAISSFMPTVNPKSTKERTGSTKAIKMGDAVIELISHIGDMERAIAWDTTVTRMRSFFGNDDVAKIIEHKFGKTMLESIREDIIRLSNGYGDITKGYQKIINDLRNNYTSATLGLDASKGVKQMTSYFAWLDVMGPVELTKGTMDFFTNIDEAVKVLGSSSLLKERGMNINADTANIKHSKSELNNFLTSPTFTNWKYLFIKLGDRAPIYAGGWAYYKKAF
jgi:hypothetical protein